MQSYVLLINFTELGVKNIRDTLDRARSFYGTIEKVGGKVREHVYTLGEYDIAMVTEFPDDETAAGAIFQLASLGNVRTTTMRAFTDEEFAGILSRVS